MGIKYPDPIIAFEEFAQASDSDSSMEFFLENTLALDSPFVECREALIYFKKDFGEFLSSSRHLTRFILEKINNEPLAFRIRRVISGEKETITGVFIVLKSSVQHIYRLITVSRGSFWTETIRPFLRDLYPYVSIVFFRQKELEDALLSLEKSMMVQYPSKVKTSVIEVTSKSEQFVPGSNKKRSVATERSWTNLSLGDTFTDLQERGFWFKSIRVKIVISASYKSSSSQRAAIRLSKNGTFSCNGMYGYMRRFLITPLEKILSERMQLLEGRGIIEREYKPGPPLEIVYEGEVFTDSSKVRQFGEVIGRYQDAAIVVYHANPYFHANIADHRDGSSFELWVLSQNRILISPQATASAQALTRIINFIFDKFKEGVVDEFRSGAN